MGVTAAAERVKEGQSLAHALETQKLFPDLAVEMLEVGESTGALPAMLARWRSFTKRTCRRLWARPWR